MWQCLRLESFDFLLCIQFLLAGKPRRWYLFRFTPVIKLAFLGNYRLHIFYHRKVDSFQLETEDWIGESFFISLNQNQCTPKTPSNVFKFFYPWWSKACICAGSFEFCIRLMLNWKIHKTLLTVFSPFEKSSFSKTTILISAINNSIENFGLSGNDWVEKFYFWLSIERPDCPKFSKCGQDVFLMFNLSMFFNHRPGFSQQRLPRQLPTKTETVDWKITEFASVVKVKIIWKNFYRQKNYFASIFKRT